MITGCNRDMTLNLLRWKSQKTVLRVWRQKQTSREKLLLGNNRMFTPQEELTVINVCTCNTSPKSKEQKPAGPARDSGHCRNGLWRPTLARSEGQRSTQQVEVEDMSDATDALTENILKEQSNQQEQNKHSPQGCTHIFQDVMDGRSWYKPQ